MYTLSNTLDGYRFKASLRLNIQKSQDNLSIVSDDTLPDNQYQESTLISWRQTVKTSRKEVEGLLHLINGIKCGKSLGTTSGEIS